MIINRFNGDNKFLSSFAACSVRYDGHLYPSIEHAYQAAKTNDESERLLIKNAISPSQAKKIGRTLTISPDWESKKNSVMLDLVRQKFCNPYFRHRLIATVNAMLIEGNAWHDNYWGSCKCNKCGSNGLNMLGKILMTVRDEVIKEVNEEIELFKKST